jgi:hypothetical protein
MEKDTFLLLNPRAVLLSGEMIAPEGVGYGRFNL